MALECLEKLDHGQSLVLGQRIAVGVAAVAATGQCGVINLAAFAARKFRVCRLVQNSDFQTEPLRIVILLVAAVRPGAVLRPRCGLENVVDRWRRAIVEIGPVAQMPSRGGA